MENVYIKKGDLKEYNIKNLERVGFENRDLISIEDLLETIDNLLYEKDYLEEKLEDEIQNRKDNYEPISPYKMYGISERDFH